MDILNPLWNNQFGTFFTSDASDIFDAEYAAVALAANALNHQKLLALQNYPFDDIYTLQKAQFSAVLSIRAGFLQIENICFYLQKLSPLNTEQILSLLKDFKRHLEQNAPNSSAKNELESAKKLENISEIAVRAQQLLSSYNLALLSEKREQIAAGEYKIAFAGCFNAGKSSLLNALLQSELLGASNAPETAAISTIRWGDEQALINYYSREEFEQIQQLASLSAECAKRLQNSTFSEIASEKIPLERLKDFNSAASEKSLQIKQIDIFLRSKLLENRLIFLDTPGLDDVMISREQASSAMLKTVDEIVYLMPATQALSSKDCDFLCALANENPAIKITLVLSKIDLVDAAEIPALEAYVRAKFSAELAKSRLKNEFLIFSLSAANASGISTFRAYLLQRANRQNEAQTRMLSASLIKLLNAELARLSDEFQTSASDEFSTACAAQENRAKKDAIKTALSTAFQQLNACEQEIKNYQALAGNDLFLLAKQIAAKVSAEYAYSAKFSENNAIGLATRAFEDFCSLKNSQSKKFLQNIAAKSAAILGCIQTALNADEIALFQSFLDEKDQDFSHDFGVLLRGDFGVATRFSTDDFSSALNKFSALKNPDESTILERLEAILNNLNLDALGQNETRQNLAKKLQMSQKRLQALCQMLTLGENPKIAGANSEPTKAQTAAQIAAQMDEIKQMINECKEFA